MINVSVFFKKSTEGGRKHPVFNGYRPNCVFGLNENEFLNTIESIKEDESKVFNNGEVIVTKKATSSHILSYKSKVMRTDTKTKKC